ncbi:MAG: YifB family Mg chelatase-like AAA ATPase [Pseudomonadota bacterium]
MVARVTTVAFQGLDIRSVDVQVQLANGLPAFTVVGLPDKAVAESRERVRCALHALGLSLPAKRITVNLAPADVVKEGSHYDLPIALGVLAVMDIIPRDELAGWLALGELALDGSITKVQGVLPTALHAMAQDLTLVCPASCGAEAVWAGDDLPILAPAHILELLNHIRGNQLLSRPQPRLSHEDDKAGITDMASVKGQETAKRALEIAAAGGHNMLMLGPPGAGKSLLSSCLPGLLPPLSPRESLDVSMIHSLAGSLPEGGLIRARPYRNPHHSASLPALIGGGSRATPGEVSLAHGGVLFLDELPEFQRTTLEALRQPLESGEAVVARVNYHARYPARFQLIGAMNPCRCGYLGDPSQECTKAPRCGEEYQGKLSGPFLDRIDLVLEVPAVQYAELRGEAGESSATVARRVARARDIQLARAQAHAKIDGVAPVNAHIGAAYMDNVTRLSATAQPMLEKAAVQFKLSARGVHRVLRVARTIADLADAPDELSQTHVAEALSYRRFRALN